MNCVKRALIFFLLLFPFLVYGKEIAGEGVKPSTVGNFSLPSSQQVAPLVSFGQYVLPKGVSQLFLYEAAFIGGNSYLTSVTPSIIYGIRDDFSILLTVPFSPGNKDRQNYSSGLQDALVQLEYAFYSKSSRTSASQATIVANATFPAGSSSKVPPTGLGANSFFIGTTFSRIWIDWYFFTSPGAILTTSKHGTKFGDQLLYQFGTARHLPSPPGWLFAAMVEVDGTYSWKNRVKGEVDPNSGGNVIYVTPSLWFSSNKLIFQFGAGYPVVQHLFGHQERKFLLVAFDLGFTF